MYLGRLAVLPTFRQHGIGHALVAAVEQKAQAAGYTKVSLSVRTALPANRAFFERLTPRYKASALNRSGPCCILDGSYHEFETCRHTPKQMNWAKRSLR